MFYVPDEILILIFKKLHRFNYLNNLLYVNKNFNTITKYIYIFHFNNLNTYLYNTIIYNIYLNKIYINIATYLFSHKILNIKKLKIFYFNVKSDLFKLLIIFNEYYKYNILLSYVRIITYNEYLQFSKSTYYFPCIFFNLNNKFYIFVEYCIITNTYRLKIKSFISNTNVCRYKSVTENDILNMFNLNKHDLLKLY